VSNQYNLERILFWKYMLDKMVHRFGAVRYRLMAIIIFFFLRFLSDTKKLPDRVGEIQAVEKGADRKMCKTKPEKTELRSPKI